MPADNRDQMPSRAVHQLWSEAKGCSPQTQDPWLKKSSQSEHDEGAWRPYDLNHRLVSRGEVSARRGQRHT